jgi:uncharacterized membrane protein YphA (DoxX/SURF4 family)
MRAWTKRWREFLFPKESDTWLAILRIGMGAQVCFYTLSLSKDWNYLFAGTGRGLISRDLSERILSLESTLVPRLGWFVTMGARLGLGEDTMLMVAWICLLVSGCLLLVGFLSRPAAIVAWFLHLSAVKSGDLVSYGMDNFTTIGLFYLMLSPLPDRYSLDWRWRGPRVQDRQLLGFFRRVLQIHLCLIYFFGGIAKSLGSGWWDGSNLWRALIRPPFNMIAPEILIRWKYVFPVAGIVICLLELGYVFLIWPKRSRLVWLLAILAMHIGVGLTMGMYLFSLIMIVLNLAAFGPGLISWRKAKVALPEQPATA